MNKETAHKLNALNRDFYEKVAGSFSATRKFAWPGWKRALTSCDFGSRARVLDVACGNLRFEKYLSKTYPSCEFEFHTVDNCDNLLGSEPATLHVNEDVIYKLIEGDELNFYELNVQLVVAFGFMHHIPTFDCRVTFLNALFDAIAPSGVAVVSLWRFMNEQKLSESSKASTNAALKDCGIKQNALDANDFLLNWQKQEHIYRYCHHFDDAEIDSLIAATSSIATCVDRFDSDGRNNALNTYLVFKKEVKNG